MLIMWYKFNFIYVIIECFCFCCWFHIVEWLHLFDTLESSVVFIGKNEFWLQGLKNMKLAAVGTKIQHSSICAVDKWASVKHFILRLQCYLSTNGSLSVLIHCLLTFYFYIWMKDIWKFFLFNSLAILLRDTEK